MKLKITFIIIIISCNLIKSQVLIPFTFDNVSPEWTHYVQGKNLSDTVQSYYSDTWPTYRAGKILEKDGYIYMSNNIWDNYYFQGYNIEKIDIETGDEVWDFTHKPTQKGEREYSFNLREINERLELMIYKEKEDGFAGWVDSRAGKRTYNIETGLMIDSLGTNELDPLNFPLETPFYTLYHPGRHTTRLYSADTGYTYLQIDEYKQEDGWNLIFKSTQLNLEGHQIEDSRINKINLGNEAQIYRTFDIDEDRIFSSFTIEKEIDSTGLQQKQTNYRIFDHSLNILGEGSLGIDDNKGVCFYVDTISILVSNTKTIDEFSKINYKLLNYNGETISNLSIDISNFKTQWVTKYIDENIVACVQSRITNSNGQIINSFTIYRTNDNNGFLKSKTFTVVEPNQDVFLDGIYSLENGDIMLKFSHEDKNLQLETNPVWTVYKTFSLESLDFATAVDKIPKTVELSVVPNPVNDYLFIQSTDVKHTSKVKIYNLNSKLVLQQSYQEQIDVSSLVPGIYFLKIIDRKMLLKTGKFIKN